MPQAIKEETMSDDEVIFMHVDTDKMTGRSKSKGKGRDQEVQVPPIAFKLERSPSMTAGPSTMSKKQERDEFNRSPSSSSSPPPAPPPSKVPVSTFNKFEAKAALARQEAAAAAAAAASSKASSAKQSHNATASSSKTKSSVSSSSKRRVSDPSSSKPSKSKSSAPKPRRSDPPASSSLSKPSSSKIKLVPGGSSFTKSLAERPSVVVSGRSVRVQGSNAVRFLENEAWEAFSQFGQIDTLDVLFTTRSNGTKDIFLTYVEREAADAAVSTINAPGFPTLEHVKKISLWTNLSLGKSSPLRAFKVTSLVFDYHMEKWLRGGGVVCYTGTGNKKRRVLIPSPDDSDCFSDESEAPPPLKRYKPSTQPEAAPIPVVEAPSEGSSDNNNAEPVFKKKRVVSSPDESESDEDSASGEEEIVPPPKTLKPSGHPSSLGSAPPKSTSKKSSANNDIDMNFQPGTVLRIPRPNPTAAAEASNVVDRKGKGREIIDLISSSDMEASPPPQDLQEVAGMDRMSLEPTRKSKTPAPLRSVPAPKKLITNDDSSADGSDDDSNSSNSDDSDAEHLDIGKLFGDLPVARPPPPSAPWMLASSSRKPEAFDVPSRSKAPPRLPSPVALGADPSGSEGEEENENKDQERSVAASRGRLAQWKDTCMKQLRSIGEEDVPNKIRWINRQMDHIRRAEALLVNASSLEEALVAIDKARASGDHQYHPMSCKDCSEKFKNPWFLDRHRLIHDPISEHETGFDFACKDCPRSFRTPRLLESHARLHIVQPTHVRMRAVV